jgi:hypothetical protein
MASMECRWLSKHAVDLADCGHFIMLEKPGLFEEHLAWRLEVA